MKKPNVAVLDLDKKDLVIDALKPLSKISNIDWIDQNIDTLNKQILNNYEILLIRLFPINKDFLRHCKKLKAIIKSGVGVDHIDVESATANNIHVCISPGNNISVAESAALLMLAVYRRLTLLDKKPTAHMLEGLGYEVYEKNLGLIGCGRIGKHLVQIAKGLGMKIFIYDPYLSQESIKELGAAPSDLDNVLRNSDVVSLHCPLTPDTYHLIDKDKIKLMKNTAIIVNTARGSIINEKDLYKALIDKKILGAGLDVFEKEPLDNNNILLKLDNVIATPHRLIQTYESVKRQIDSMVVSATNIINNEVPYYSINKDKVLQIS